MRDVVRFSQGAFQAELRLPMLPKLPLTSIRRLFVLMLSEEPENEEAIRDTEGYLELAVSDSRELWRDASVRYQEEWRLPEKPVQQQSPKKKQAAAAIRAHNETLTRAVKKAKGSHERWVKIQALWNAAKHKMQVKE